MSGVRITIEKSMTNVYTVVFCTKLETPYNDSHGPFPLANVFKYLIPLPDISKPFDNQYTDIISGNPATDDKKDPDYIYLQEAKEQMATIVEKIKQFASRGNVTVNFFGYGLGATALLYCLKQIPNLPITLNVALVDPISDNQVPTCSYSDMLLNTYAELGVSRLADLRNVAIDNALVLFSQGQKNKEKAERFLPCFNEQTNVTIDVLPGTSEILCSFTKSFPDGCTPNNKESVLLFHYIRNFLTTHGTRFVDSMLTLAPELCAQTDADLLKLYEEYCKSFKNTGPRPAQIMFFNNIIQSSNHKSYLNAEHQALALGRAQEIDYNLSMLDVGEHQTQIPQQIPKLMKPLLSATVMSVLLLYLSSYTWNPAQQQSAEISSDYRP